MHVVVFYAIVSAIRGKFAIRICRPFQANVFEEEEKKVGLSLMGFTATACCLHADFMRRGALIMTFRDVSGEALMCPQNGASIAR